MNGQELGMTLASCVTASFGQVLWKVGAHGRVSLLEYLNWPMVVGSAFYGASVLLWWTVLRTVPLNKIVAYTALTLILVMLISKAVLREPFTLWHGIGSALIVAGLFCFGKAGAV